MISQQAHLSPAVSSQEKSTSRTEHSIRPYERHIRA